MRRITAIVGSPEFLFYLNVAVLAFLLPWTALLALPGSPLFALGKQVWYVTFISHVALILGALSTLQAARVEIKQAEAEIRRLERDEQLEEKLDAAS